MQIIPMKRKYNFGALVGVAIFLSLLQWDCAAATAPGMGDAESVSSDARSVSVKAGADELIVRVCEPGIIRVDFRKSGRFDPDTPVLDPQQKWDQPVTAEIHTDVDPMVIRTQRLIVKISKHPCRVSFYDLHERSLLTEPQQGGIFVDPDSDERGGLRFQHRATDHFYGVKAFDIHGSESDAAAGTLLRGGAGSISQTFQANASTQGGCGGPFIWTTGGYGVVVDSDNGFFTADNNQLSFAFGAPSPGTNGRLYAKKNSVRYFLMVGNPKEIFAELSDITGHAPMFPKWAVGFTNSQWGITEDAAIAAIDHYRAAAIPIDNFTFDFDWKAWGEDHFGEFRWNQQKFPSADNGGRPNATFSAKMISRQMHITGIMKPRIVRFTDPQGAGPQTVQGKEANDRGFWLPGLSWHKDYQSSLPCGELDFSKPDCRAWFWENLKIHGAMQGGISGFWNDEADEADLGNRHHVVFNNFEHMRMEQALYEGQRAWAEQGHTVNRVWSLNRNFYLGAQRYAYGTWSGDIASGFDSMALQPARMLSAIALGQMRWSMDTGGFHGTPNPENYARWMQFASLVPIFRVHGSYEEHRQPWVYGEQAETAAADAIRLRYHLAPYIYACDRELYETGVGLVRPLMVEFPHDPKSADVADEWMVGDSLLAAPVLAEHATSRKIYLPPRKWIDYFRGDVIQGGQSISYPISTTSWMDIPLFIRAGAIIAEQDVTPSIGFARPDHLDVDIFPDSHESSSEIYDDDGETYAYESDGFFKQRFVAGADHDGVSLQIDPAQGKYIPSVGYYLCHIHGPAAAKVTVDGKILTEVSTPAALISTTNAWCRGRDVYGQYTLIHVGISARHIQLSGSHPVDSSDEILEAEDGTPSGETTDTQLSFAHDHANFSGRGFVGGFNHPWSALSLSVKRHAAGDYAASLRIADDHHEQSLSLYVNGIRSQTLLLPATPDWNTWREIPVTLPLAAGNNALMLRRDPEDTGDVNIDYVKIPFTPKPKN